RGVRPSGRRRAPRARVARSRGGPRPARAGNPIAIVDPMCGIVGYVGRRAARELLLAGLGKLEYRGYDSAGISVIAAGRIEAVRAVGTLSALQAKLDGESVLAREDGAVALAARPAGTGIGHTRWATHGCVSEENAHPHYDSADRVHVVVNGIVENYLAL